MLRSPTGPALVASSTEPATLANGVNRAPLSHNCVRILISARTSAARGRTANAPVWHFADRARSALGEPRAPSQLTRARDESITMLGRGAGLPLMRRNSEVPGFDQLLHGSIRYRIGMGHENSF